MQEIICSLEKDEETWMKKKSLEDFGKKLLSALSSFGLVQLVSHGIPIASFKEGFDSSLQFFNLKNSIKNKYAIDHQRFHGYIGSGNFFNVTANKVDYDCREAFNINALDDTLLPNKNDLPKFGQSFIEMAGLFDKLVSRILMALALALGKDSDYLINMYKHQFTDKNFTTLKTLFYPAIPENECSENTGVNIIRLGEHTDYGPMTLLYQDNTGGLEVKCPKTSKWVRITPNENAIILNMGDLFEIMTSGHIPSALHQVSTSKESKDRQSIAFFVHFDHESIVMPIENLEAHPINHGKVYLTVQSEEYVRGRLNNTIEK